MAVLLGMGMGSGVSGASEKKANSSEEVQAPSSVEKMSKDEYLASLSGIVATIDGGKIKISKDEFTEVYNELYPIVLKRFGSADKIDVSILGREVLDRLITEKLLIEEVKKEKVTVNKEDEAKSLEGMYAQFGGEEKMKAFLKEKKIDLKKFMENFRSNLRISKLVNEKVIAGIVVSDEEAEKFFNENRKMFQAGGLQVKASHILIRVKPDADEKQKREAKRKIKNILEKLKNGEDFAQLAKEYSEGPSKASGGDLGYISKGQMVKPFEEALFALKKGEVSDIVETPFGYHLIKVFDIKEPKPIEFAQVKEVLKKQLKQAKSQGELKKYYENLRKNRKITINL